MREAAIEHNRGLERTRDKFLDERNRTRLNNELQQVRAKLKTEEGTGQIVNGLINAPFLKRPVTDMTGFERTQSDLREEAIALQEAYRNNPSDPTINTRASALASNLASQEGLFKDSRAKNRVLLPYIADIGTKGTPEEAAEANNTAANVVKGLMTLEDAVTQLAQIKGVIDDREKAADRQQGFADLETQLGIRNRMATETDDTIPVVQRATKAGVPLSLLPIAVDGSIDLPEKDINNIISFHKNLGDSRERFQVNRLDYTERQLGRYLASIKAPGKTEEQKTALLNQMDKFVKQAGTSGISLILDPKGGVLIPPSEMDEESRGMALIGNIKSQNYERLGGAYLQRLKTRAKEIRNEIGGAVDTPEDSIIPGSIEDAKRKEAEAIEGKKQSQERVSEQKKLARARDIVDQFKKITTEAGRKRKIELLDPAIEPYVMEILTNESPKLLEQIGLS
jgi:hypothetical protein